MQKVYAQGAVLWQCLVFLQCLFHGQSVVHNDITVSWFSLYLRSSFSLTLQRVCLLQCSFAWKHVASALWQLQILHCSFFFRCHTSLFVIPIVASGGILLRVRFLLCVCLSSVATSSFLSFKSSCFLRLCLGPCRFGLCCRFTCFLVLIFSPLITPLVSSFFWFFCCFCVVFLFC